MSPLGSATRRRLFAGETLDFGAIVTKKQLVAPESSMTHVWMLDGLMIIVDNPPKNSLDHNFS